jgi:hypothetical protein
MRSLRDWEFDASRPLQTKRGAAQAFRCGLDKIDDLIETGALELVYIKSSPRVTTKSIMNLAAKGTREVA